MPLRFPFRSVLVLALCVSSCAPESATSECTGTKPSLVESDVLTVAADLTFRPFAYDRPDEDPAGFEADLVRTIAKAMKVRPRIVNRGQAVLVPGLIAHRHDLAAAGLRDTDELTDEVCTSAPYLDADLAIVVPAPDPHDIGGADDLDGRTVGVVERSGGERWARDHLTASSLKPLAADTDLLDALRARRVDAVVADLALARYEAKRSRKVSVASVIATGEGYVLAGARDNGGLIARVNEILAKLERNGKLAKIRAKWFGE